MWFCRILFALAAIFGIYLGACVVIHVIHGEWGEGFWTAVFLLALVWLVTNDAKSVAENV